MNIKDRVQLAAIHMKQANIGLVAKSLFGSSSSLNPSTYRGKDFFMEIGAGNVKGYSFTGKGNSMFVEAFNSCPPLSAIIMKKALAYSNGENWVVEDDGKGSDKVAKSKPAKAIRKLLRKPNPIQTFTEFEELKYAYIEVFGYCPIWVKKPVGFPNYEADALWILPPNQTTIEFDDTVLGGYKIKSVSVNFNGKIHAISPDSIFIFRGGIPSFGDSYLPSSKIPTLEDPINNIIDAYESRGVLIRNRGAQGIISNQTQDSAGFIQLDPMEQEEIQSKLKMMYGRMKHQSPFIVTSSNLKWQSMLMPTKDLMLFEEIEDSADRICDAYGFPKPLFSSMGKGTTYSNMQTAERNLYQDTIIPESKKYYKQWDDFFDCLELGLIIQKDYSQLSVLQPDLKAEAEALLRRNQAFQIEFRNNQVTQNEWRKANYRDPKPDGNVYYSDIRELLDAPMNIEDDQVEDNLNPRSADNDGTPGQQA